MTTPADTPLPDSARQLPEGAERVSDLDPDEVIQVSVLVRGTTDAPSGAAPTKADPNTPQGRRELRADYARSFGADPADLAKVSEYAAEHGLQVVTSDAARRTVTLSGPASAMSAAFGVTLGKYRTADATFRGREGVVHLPAALDGIVTSVLGLDDRPQARAHFVKGEPMPEDDLPTHPKDPGGSITAMAHASHPTGPVPLWTSRVAQLYNFPTTAGGRHLDGTGQTIAIIELGGGFRDRDLDAYFTKAGIARPNIVAVSVGSGSNQPGGDADGEVLLDIEVAGSVAPGADIVVYFADGASDRGFLDALTTAVHDQDHAPSVISISWGGPEAAWTAQGANEFERALKDAAALHVTVLVAAGDHGAGDAAKDGKPHADFPAASPYVIACGGTTLVGDDSGIVSEVVWNDNDGWAGGGGRSAYFQVPSYQRGVTLPDPLEGGHPGRGVPDIGGNADITSGYIIRADGHWAPVGGTSAVAPLASGLVALLNQGLGSPVGYLTPKLYQAASHPGVFRDITSGDNSTPSTRDFGPGVAGYQAGPGWDACTGLGSIDGTALLAALMPGSGQGSVAHPGHGGHAAPDDSVDLRDREDLTAAEVSGIKASQADPSTPPLSAPGN